MKGKKDNVLKDVKKALMLIHKDSYPNKTYKFSFGKIITNGFGLPIKITFNKKYFEIIKNIAGIYGPTLNLEQKELSSLYGMRVVVK